MQFLPVCRQGVQTRSRRLSIAKVVNAFFQCKLTLVLGHIPNHRSEKPFYCTYPGCKACFARKYDCQRHRQTHNEAKQLECRPCKKSFGRGDALTRHRAFKPFNALSWLTDVNAVRSPDHKRKSTADQTRSSTRKYECETPETEKGDYRRRRGTHDKPFNCESCDKSYGRRDEFTRHCESLPIARTACI